MRRSIVVHLAFVAGLVSWPVLFALGNSVETDPGTQMAPARSSIKIMNTRPLAFTENAGQWDERVLFRADAHGATMWFTRDAVYYQLTRRIATYEPVADPPLLSRPGLSTPPSPCRPGEASREQFESLMIKVSFVGTNLNCRPVCEELMEYRSNYFLGDDPARWRTDVPSYGAIVYQGIYDGIDLRFFADGDRMKEAFLVSPLSDPSQIRIQYEGTRSLSVTESGELVVETEWKSFADHGPQVYQLDGDHRIAIECRYSLSAERGIEYVFGGDRDPNLPLLIDPMLNYSTYLGGSLDDYG